MKCLWCDEEVLAGEKSEALANGTMHWECALRWVAGPVAHLQRKCSCYVSGSEENDPEGMTRREAAKAAAQLYLKLEELGVKVP